uniref:BV6 family protein n=1 Tax=Glyptapanteles indiensis TaxID=92994 RepID=B7S947_GLYIN|nr:conserved hypothetical protein [Glyptapanteles indiensis]
MSKHVCLVPNEWSKYYSQNVLEVIIKKDMSCDSISKKVEGTKINVNGVTAQLRYHGNQPWLRKEQDKRTFPNPKEYFGVYMSCNDCRKPTFMFIMAHQLVCWVPREWLASSWNSLQVVLFEEMSLQFYNHGTIEGTAIRVGNTTAYLRYHEIFRIADDLRTSCCTSKLYHCR